MIVALLMRSGTSVLAFFFTSYISAILIQAFCALKRMSYLFNNNINNRKMILFCLHADRIAIIFTDEFVLVRVILKIRPRPDFINCTSLSFVLYR